MLDIRLLAGTFRFRLALTLFLVGLACLLVPSYKEQCESYHAGREYCAAYDMAATVGHVIKANDAVITALATAAIAIFTWTIWRVNRNELAHSHQVERAYISGGGAPEMRAEGRPMGSLTTGKIIHIPVPTGRFTVHINNQGKTAGEIFEIAVEFCNAGAVPAKPVYNNRIHHHNWIGPGTQSRSLFSVPIPTDLTNLIVYGRFYYRDIFSDTMHSSGFIQDIDLRAGQSQSVAPPSRAYTEWD
jgi:hypothetical protein